MLALADTRLRLREEAALLYSTQRLRHHLQIVSEHPKNFVAGYGKVTNDAATTLHQDEDI